MLVDSISNAVVSRKGGSSPRGAINSAKSAKSVILSLDKSSVWKVTATSYLTVLNDVAGIAGGVINNIVGNGHTVYYSASANPTLRLKTYTLRGGGTLTPAQP